VIEGGGAAAIPAAAPPLLHPRPARAFVGAVFGRLPSRSAPTGCGSARPTGKPGAARSRRPGTTRPAPHGRASRDLLAPSLDATLHIE